MPTISIVDIQTHKSAINKTNAGGFGTSSNYSNSNNLFAQFLKLAKKIGVRIPLPEFGYICALLETKGYSYDVHIGSYENIRGSDIYLIYGSLVEYTAEIKASELIRSRYPNARIAFFGLLPTVKPDLFVEHCDFLVSGEIESFFHHLNEDLIRIEGIRHAPFLAKLDELPFPIWSKVENCFHFSHKPFFGTRKMFPIVSSRGCPLSCKHYCAYPLMAGGKVRTRSSENIVSEIEYLIKGHGMQAVMFRDPTFSIVPKRVAELCELVLKTNLKFHWSCETHPAFLTEDLLKLMYKAGNRAIEIGIETRNQDIIKNTYRHDTPQDHLRTIINTAESLGIKVSGQYIIGSMDENLLTIEDTVAYAKSLRTSYAQFSICTPYPGTKFYDEVEHLITTDDWTKFDTFTLVFNHPHLTAKQLETLKEKAFHDYYFRVNWLLKFGYRTIRDTFNRR